MTDDRFAPRLRDLMRELAGEDDLFIEDVLARTARTPQRPAWAFVSRWMPTLDTPVVSTMPAGRVLPLAALIAMLLMLLATFALVGGQAPRPPTLVAPVIAERFVMPFEYTIPQGSELAATTVSRQMYALTEGSSTTYPGFGYQPVSDIRGITIAFAAGASTHGADGRATLRLRPETLLEDLQGNPTLAVGLLSGTTVGGLAAVRSDIATAVAAGSASYPDLHLDPLASGDTAALLALAFPGTLTVAQVDGGILIVHVWAADAEELKAWLPLAEGLASSIRFLEEP